jgi:hypothetical protein
MRLRQHSLHFNTTMPLRQAFDNDGQPPAEPKVFSMC